MKKVKTVNDYIDDNMESLDGKIITVYNDDKNIIWRGKAEYAPLYLKMELKSVETKIVDTIDGDTVEEVIINGVTTRTVFNEVIEKILINEGWEILADAPGVPMNNPIWNMYVNDWDIHEDGAVKVEIIYTEKYNEEGWRPNEWRNWYKVPQWAAEQIEKLIEE